MAVSARDWQGFWAMLSLKDFLSEDWIDCSSMSEYLEKAMRREEEWH
jgi:hypothetical protein